MAKVEGWPHIEFDDRMQKHFVGGRVPISRLWAWHRRGVTCEMLFKRYPQLGPSKILTALAFAYENQELMVRQENPPLPEDPKQTKLGF